MPVVNSTELVISAFLHSSTQPDYVNALRWMRALAKHDQLLALDALFEAAERLGLDRQSGDQLAICGTCGKAQVTEHV